MNPLRRLFIVVIICLPIQIVAQATTGQVEETRGTFQFTVVNEQGWNLPNKADFRVQEIDDVNIGGMPAVAVYLRPLNEINVRYENFFKRADGTLTTTESEMRILGMSEYVIGENTFARIIAYGSINVRPDGSKALKGQMFRVAYVDSDGDGLFETRQSNSRSFATIPDWATRR